MLRNSPAGALHDDRDPVDRVLGIGGVTGVGMARGMRAARTVADDTEGGVRTVLRAAGDAFGDKAGGTSGMLWGLFLATIGDELGDTDEVAASGLAAAVRRGADAIQRVGKAELGDKTMLDALLPFVDALEAHVDEGMPLTDAWNAAAQVCVEAAEATRSLTPKIGRARPLAERSVGTPDAGATSMGLIVTAVGPVLADAPCNR